MEGLRLEWQRESPKLQGKQVVSVYFGGGTPSLLSPAYLAEILDWVHPHLSPDSEITIEANPEESGQRLFEEFLDLGINRLSLGVQSLDDSSLQEIERIHSAERAERAIREAELAGFKNISIDLMFDLPGQTEASWARTLAKLPGLPITHLSLYNLTIEPHTPFFKRKEAIEKRQPQGEASLRLLEAALDAFEEMGLKRYEISAFAKDGLISKHNTGYWTGRPFLGFGPSAFSYWEGKRYSNISNLQKYRKGGNTVDFSEELPYPDNVHERFAVRLRLLEGASKEELPKETLAKLKTLAKEGYLEEEKERWKLTDRGRLFYDTVAAEII